jgi:hypothetical protein
VRIVVVARAGFSDGASGEAEPGGCAYFRFLMALGVFDAAGGIAAGVSDVVVTRP